MTLSAIIWPVLKKLIKHLLFISTILIFITRIGKGGNILLMSAILEDSEHKGEAYCPNN